MSVISPTGKIRYQLSEADETLPYPYYFISADYLKVLRVRNGVTTQLTTGFTINGAGDPDGGEVVLDGTQTDDDDVIVIKRDAPLTQLTTYTPNARFPANVHERSLDYLTMLIQQISERIDRALSFGEGEGLSAALSLSGRKGKVLGFNETTGAIEFVENGEGSGGGGGDGNSVEMITVEIPEGVSFYTVTFPEAFDDVPQVMATYQKANADEDNIFATVAKGSITEANFRVDFNGQIPAGGGFLTYFTSI